MLRSFVCEQQRKKFIDGCVAFDTPRLNTEVYPEDVRCESDILYDAVHKMDCYSFEEASGEEDYLLIHGGAFVYGSKELDKCFGMHLSKASSLMVANVDYTLMPEGDLKTQVQDIFAAIDYLMREKNTKVLHTVGDSAGGYLALLIGLLLHSKEARKEFGLTRETLPAIKSINMICCTPGASPHTFAGYYFDRNKQLPRYIYDLTKAIELYGCPTLTFMSSDQDPLLKINRRLTQRLGQLGVEHTYKEFTSVEGRVMHHVFPVAHPTWPEGQEVIRMFLHPISKNQ